jgi:hypothetical protein
VSTTPAINGKIFDVGSFFMFCLIINDSKRILMAMGHGKLIREKVENIVSDFQFG